MSGLEIAVSIPAFVAVARKVVAGISRLADLRHAPDVLLALNNEIADLQCVIVSPLNGDSLYYMLMRLPYASRSTSAS